MSAGASSSRSGAAAAAAAGGSLSSRMQSLSVAGAVAPSALDSLSGVHGLRLPGLPGLGGGGGGDVDEDREGHMAERRKIRAAFSLFDRDGKKVVPKESDKQQQQKQQQGGAERLSRTDESLIATASTGSFFSPFDACRGHLCVCLPLLFPFPSLVLPPLQGGWHHHALPRCLPLRGGADG